MTVYLDRIIPEETPNPAGFCPAEVLEHDCYSCNMILKDFRVVLPVSATTVSACGAAQYEACFTFEHANMVPTPVRMKTLVIDQGTAFYTLRMYDAPDFGGAGEFDYSRFIASVRMV